MIFTRPRAGSTEEKEGGVSFAAPDDRGYINVEITNTALNWMVIHLNALWMPDEANYLAGKFDGYEVINREVDKDSRVARITKRFNFNGVPQVVFTHYDQFGPIIYSIDFWADADIASAYQDTYQEIDRHRLALTAQPRPKR